MLNPAVSVGLLTANAMPAGRCALYCVAQLLGALLSGTVVVEKIFERRGLGTLFLNAFFDRDMPVVQGCVLVIATTYVVVNVLLDLAYAAADPRVRLE